MFIKTITVTDRKTKMRYTYYRLCESYRIGGTPRHRNILDLGTLDELTDKREHKLLADCIESIVYKKPFLFQDAIPDKIKQLANHFSNIIVSKKLLDLPLLEGEDKKKEEVSDYEEIDINSLEHKEAREIGSEWLCKQTLDNLGLEKHLRGLGFEEKWINLAMVFITGRAIYPASDKKTEEWLKLNSGLCELYNLDFRKVNRHQLYKVSRMLYDKKDEIECYLSKSATELFELDDKIILYDLTNVYFEGEKRESEKCKRGKSKERRNDAKLMALALITDIFGFIKRSKIYEGNVKDEKTFKEVLLELEEKDTTKREGKRIVVMDAGIATEENLSLLRNEENKDKYDYVAVSRSQMKEIEIKGIEESAIELTDRKGNKIIAKWVKEGEENILYVKSFKKELKEKSMIESFSKRFEEGLEEIKSGIKKKGGVKKRDKVSERIGRLKEKYPSVWRLYEIKIKSKRGIVEEISWNKKEGNQREGVYFIRTTFKEKDEKIIWKIYNYIREIESAFRTLKTDLKIRPIEHQKDIYSESHIYGSLLAYQVANTIRHNLKIQGIHDDWSNIVRIMNSQKMITTAMKTRSGRTIYLKKISKPQEEVNKIYQALRYKDKPFWQKKSVLPKNENPTLSTPDTG
jgi:hypothetical protein